MELICQLTLTEGWGGGKADSPIKMMEIYLLPSSGIICGGLVPLAMQHGQVI